jgi:hypothetical protein
LTLVESLYDEFRAVGRDVQIATLTIGLGYTAVETSAGDVGLAYTPVGRGESCTRVRTYRDYEGALAGELLMSILSDDEMERALGLALVNALNRRAALALPVDNGREEAFVRLFAIGRGVHVAMVGFFGPVVQRLQRLGAEVEVLDRDRHLGDEARFLRLLQEWADVLVISATTILNGSLERFVAAASQRVRTVVLGPSTPLVPSAYRGLAVHVIAGMVPVEGPRVLSAVRQGAGTPQLTPLCRRVYRTLEAAP